MFLFEIIEDFGLDVQFLGDIMMTECCEIRESPVLPPRPSIKEF